MRIRLLSLVIVFCAMPLISPAGEKADNPFKKAKIGDYVVYKVTTSANGKEVEQSKKQTVTAKNEKELTMQTAVTWGGKTVNDKDTKIDLTKPYDMVADFAAGFQKEKWKKTGDGKEKVKVGDKTYDCNWIAFKGVVEVLGDKSDSEIKVWVAKSVPLGGLVKMEIKSGLTSIRTEITESGGAK
jgi:hypothetical protein